MISKTREISNDRKGKVKEPVPYLSDTDLKAHMQAFPMSAIEKAQHFIKMNSTEEGGLLLDSLNKLNNTDPEMRDVIHEVYELGKLKNSCAYIVDKFADEQKKTQTEIRLSKYNYLK